MLKGCTGLAGAVLALGLAACSTSVKLPSLGGPTPDQPQELDCDALRMERTRLLAERDDLKSPLLSRTDAEREAELTRVNGALFTVERALWEKSCPAVTTVPAGSVVR